jgi:hypothetical protein
MYCEGGRITSYLIKNGQASLSVNLEAQDSRIKNRRSETELKRLLSEKGYKEQTLTE